MFQATRQRLALWYTAVTRSAAACCLPAAFIYMCEPPW